MWLAGATIDEIADATNTPKMTIADTVNKCTELETLPNSYKVSAQFADADFNPPIYNIWTFAKKTNGTATLTFWSNAAVLFAYCPSYSSASSSVAGSSQSVAPARSSSPMSVSICAQSSRLNVSS